MRVRGRAKLPLSIAANLNPKRQLRSAPYTYFDFNRTTTERFATLSAMDNSIMVCGRTFTPQLIQYLNEMLVEQPHISHTTLAREACERLHWCSPTGRLCLSSAKVSLHKLQDLELLHFRKSKADPHHHGDRLRDHQVNHRHMRKSRPHG